MKIIKKKGLQVTFDINDGGRAVNIQTLFMPCNVSDKEFPTFYAFVTFFTNSICEMENLFLNEKFFILYVENAVKESWENAERVVAKLGKNNQSIIDSCNGVKDDRI